MTGYTHDLGTPLHGVFSISVVSSLPGLDRTATVEAKQLQADGRGSMAMLDGGLLQIKNKKSSGKIDLKENIYPLVDHHVPQ